MNMQCKDIPTLPILAFLKRHEGRWCNWSGLEEAQTTEMWDWYARSVRNAMPNHVPDKLILAKMRMLISKGLVDGCACGCRGDFELTERGKQVLVLAMELLSIAVEKFAQAEFDRGFKGEGDPDTKPVGILHSHTWFPTLIKLKDGRIMTVDRCECGLERECSVINKWAGKAVTGGFVIPESFAKTYPGGKEAITKELIKDDPTLTVEFYEG
jgi:hypothetical protein